MGGMSELRYRRPDQATASGSDEPQRQDPPYRGQEIRRTGVNARPAADVRPDRNDGGGYDADAAFKRPVPKPPGYLPDDTGGRTSVWVALRRRGDRVAEPSQRYDPDAVADPARRKPRRVRHACGRETTATMRRARSSTDRTFATRSTIARRTVTARRSPVPTAPASRAWMARRAGRRPARVGPETAGSSPRLARWPRTDQMRSLAGFGPGRTAHTRSHSAKRADLKE